MNDRKDDTRNYNRTIRPETANFEQPLKASHGNFSVPYVIEPRDDATVVSCITLDPSLVALKPADRETRWGNGDVRTSPKAMLPASGNASTPKRVSPNHVMDGRLSTSGQRGLDECLNYISSSEMGELDHSVLVTLAALVKENPLIAQTSFTTTTGMSCLQKLLWSTDRFQLAVTFEVIIALVDSRRTGVHTRVASSEGFDNCIDAVLVKMQSHKADETIQTLGCILFDALAREGCKNSRFDDGTGSGAVTAVVSAMEAHMNSNRVQVSGVQALCSQCTVSKNAERNKQTVAGLTFDSGITSSQILQKALLLATFTSDLADPLCHLYKALSSSPGVVQQLAPVSDVLRYLLSLIRVLQTKSDSSRTMTAAFGALANLTSAEKNHRGINMSAALSLAMELMSIHSDNIDLQSEARRFVANILPSTKDVEALVQSGSVATIFTSILEPSLDEPEVLDGVRVLKCFVELSNEARSEFLRFELHPHMKTLLVKFKSSILLYVELSYLLLKTIDSDEISFDQSTIVVGLACQIMSQHPTSEDVQAAGCRILSDVARHKSCCTAVAESRALDLVNQAMKRFEKSKVIHLNGCFILWKAASTGSFGNFAVHFQHRCLDSVVSSIQDHVEDPQTCEMGFNALWGLIRESEILQARLVDMMQSVEVLSHALVLHSSAPGFLEKSHGILVTLCSSSPDRAASLVTSSAVEAVVNVMIHNRSDPTLHHLCIMYLKSALVAKPRLDTEGCLAVTSVLQALNASRGNDDIQHCTCLLLWLLSQSSSETRRMIMEAEGYAMLIETFKLSNNADVRDAACLALNELLPERGANAPPGITS
jgi:hypothetical protein